MDNDRLVKISKYLSKHLRHQPERLGLKVASGGWVEVDLLLAACASHNFAINRAELEEVVARNDKQRFSFDETGHRIRANQGHSIEVDLQLEMAVPPPVLYHGTGERSVELIEAAGLRKMARHHIHLSHDVETAKKVGARHGRPAVFAVDTVGMLEAGHEFYVSANGVWLVDSVPAQHLRLL
jgi:putative RNA 2'-phosphotransferase